MNGGTFMKRYFRQEGYTLLLTLVIVVLLFLVTATFTVASMNQTKQISSTDTTIVATSLAEMGVEFAESSISNEYLIQKEQAINKKNGKSNKTLTAQELQTINSTLVTKIESLEGQTLPLKKDGQTIISKYTLTDISKSETNDLYTFTFLIDGYDKGKSKRITAKFEVDKITNSNAVSQSLVTSSFKELLEKYPTKFYTVNEPNTGNHANLSFTDKITYFKSPTTTVGQQFKGDGLNNTYYFSEGSVIFDKHIVFTNIYFEAAKLTITSNSESKAEISGSTIIVSDALIEIGNNDNQNKKSMPLVNKSKLCISSPNPNNLSITKNNLEIDSTSFVIIKATNESTSGRYKYLNEANFIKECKLTTPITENTVDPLVEVKY